MIKMDKEKEKLTFSKIEILFMVVMVALVIISGITVFSLTTRNKNISNFKEDTEFIISIAKNAHASFFMQDKTSHLYTSADGTTKGMCFTINGLIENDFLSKDYKDWDGYVVIEEPVLNQFKYSVWITNKKYVIDGYDSSKISELTINEGLTAYNDDKFTTKVKTSFTGTTKEKGGTGLSDKNVKRYEGTCINEKIE